MEFSPLDQEIRIIIKVRLIAKGTDMELSGPEYTVRLYDKDLFDSDYLGESLLNDEGTATFEVYHRDFSQPLNLENKPDFYFVVYKNGLEIFKSKVMSNLDLSNLKEFVMREGEIIDLGTFLIEG